MKKRIVLSIIMIAAVFMLAGCFKKTVLTSAEFKERAEKLGYHIVDISEQYASAEQMKEAIIAVKEGYQTEFYVLDTAENAKSMFEKNKDNFESKITGTSSKSEANMGNYNTYTLNNNGEYYHLCRVDNTLLFVHVKDQYKEDVTKLIDELGY